MIAKGKAIAHGNNAMDYGLSKEKAEVIDKQFVYSDSQKDIREEFKQFQDLNTRAKNKDLSFVLSPEPADGRKLTNKDFQDISRDFLSKMGLKNNQSITVKHTDADHTHLHIYVNRINPEGKAYNDSKLTLKSGDIADKIALERNLTRAQVVRDYNLEMSKDIKQQIFDKHKAVLQHRPKDFEQYTDLMKSSGIKVIPSMTDKGKKLQGFSLEFQGQKFKASAVHRSMSLPKMAMNNAVGINPTLKVVQIAIEKTITKGFSRGM